MDIDAEIWISEHRIICPCIINRLNANKCLCVIWCYT